MQRWAVPLSAGLIGASLWATRAKWLNTAHARSDSSSSSSLPVENTAQAIELGPDQFKTLLRNQQKLFVTFYAPWCPHCRSIFPVLDQVAAQGSSQLNSVLVCKLDADKYDDIRGHFNVRFFPTIMYMAPGTNGVYTVAQYDGERDVETMTKWVRDISTFIEEGNANPTHVPKPPLFPEKKRK